MKRSEINEILRFSKNFIEGKGFILPPFAYWTPEDWAAKGAECDEIRDAMLGWDITDYGKGEFEKIGLLLFTVRNGVAGNPNYTKPYAEKIMVLREGQLCTMHFHWAKVEDIINRGGGDLMIQLYNSTADDKLADTPVHVSIDGCRKTFDAGTTVRIRPGESITLPQRMYHAFWGDPGKGTVLVGEVSMVNDDKADNRFYEEMGRFPEIEEDEKALHLLCNEYPRA